VAAYNEEDCIVEKIENSLAQDYPSDKIEFLFITDGSSDNTTSLVSQYPALRNLHQPERKGKSAALNRAVSKATGDILIFSDANTILNKEAVRYIASHYQDPWVGGVAGEKKVLASPDGAGQVGDSEGLYWKYESALKKLDSRFYSVVGAAGELFSLRHALYEPISENVILDDFVCSLKVAQKGYRVLYEPNAYAMELPSFSITDERKRKIRIAAGGFQAIGILTPLLAFWKYPRLSFLYISHRVLRWTLSPLCLILAFLTAALLCFSKSGLLYQLAFAGQLAFYGAALATIIFPALKERSKLAKLAYYFYFMNYSVILGFFRFLRGRQPATWEKARRASAEA
jgi:cellulose synthase/poly-beta-1,6-N-acetylglucosamine synthase-like glycosyltransferase